MKEKKLVPASSCSLDFMRGISAQFVVIGHGISFCGIFKWLQYPNSPWMQNIAVVIFFILSGFVISYSIAGKKRVAGYTFPYFVADRFSRIYAALIPAILFVCVLDCISLNLSRESYRYLNAFDLKTFIGNLLMLQDFPKIGFVTSFGSARPLWTLAVEWWIYCLAGYLAFVFLSMKKIELKNICILSLLLIVPLFNFLGGRGNGLTLYWLFGSLAFVIWHIGLLDGIHIQKKIAILIVVSAAAFLHVLHTLKEYEPIFAFLLTLIILLVVDISSYLSLNATAYNFSGFISSYAYSLYLVHYSIFDFLVSYFSQKFDGYLIFVAGFILSNIIAMILGRIFEVKGTQLLKARLYKFIDSRI